MIEKIYELLPKGAYIAHSGVTGYGEAFLKRALGIDIGEVETMAHYRAARYFCPDVSFILDIGGQDMKCCKVRDGYIEDIVFERKACLLCCAPSSIHSHPVYAFQSINFAKEGFIGILANRLGFSLYCIYEL